MNWKNMLSKPRQEMFLSTGSKKGIPHNIAVLSLGLVDNKILIGVCIMKTTMKNLKENNKVSLAAKIDGKYLRIEGKAITKSSGKYLDKAIKMSNPPLPKKALLIEIKEIFDMEAQKKLF